MAKFIFKKDLLIQNIQKLKKSFKEYGLNFEIFYSVKTNFSKPVLDTINEHCRFEIVSAYEWEKIKEYKPQEIVLNGPSKSEKLVKDIIDSGVKEIFFNVDNDTDIEIIDNLSKKYLDHLTVGLRVYLNSPGIWTRFGYDISSKKIKEVVNKLDARLEGFHFHFSTNNFSINNYRLMLIEINNSVKKYKLDIKYIDIGGGLPGANEIIYQKTIYQELPKLIKELIPNNIFIISEVGRNIVQNTFDLETKIVSKKALDNSTIDITIDANIMHFPCFWEKKYSIEHTPKDKRSLQKPTTVNIFGNSCMQIDKISENYLLNTIPNIGDIIVISNIGAYSLSQASNFISEIPEISTSDN